MKRFVLSVLVMVVTGFAVKSQEMNFDVMPQIYKDVAAPPGVYRMDYIKDIKAYFSFLHEERGVVGVYHVEEDKNVVPVAIEQLHAFVNGDRKSYPYSEVMNAITTVAFELGYIDGHGGVEQGYINLGEAFLYRFMEQAVYYCPDITKICHKTTSDSSAGIMAFKSWNKQDGLMSFLLYKSGDGHNKVMRITTGGQVTPEKIFKMHHQGRDYLLCSSYGSSASFSQLLFAFREYDNEPYLAYSISLNPFAGNSGFFCITDGDNYMTRVDIPENVGLYDCKITFNPTKYKWEWCSKKGEYYHRVDGTPVVYVSLSDDDFGFNVEF